MSEDNRQTRDEKREQELSSIDRLFHEIQQYCTGAEFIKKLEFYTKFPYIGAYNAALVQEQRPGARFVLTARKWKKEYNRKIKRNSRPVMILIPFYPVEFLFDISDTEPIDNVEDDDRVIEEIIKQHIASCKYDLYYYMNFLSLNLPRHGIYYKKDYIVGSEIQAESRVDNSKIQNVWIYNDSSVKYKNHFSISVDVKADGAEEIALLFHELAHIFCHHISYPWWKKRNCSEEEKEFEAEAVSFLVCHRLGINYNPVKYLSNYMSNDLEIPYISMERVFQAVDFIEQAATENIQITRCLLYKNDEDFKSIVDSERERRRKQHEAEKAARQSI